MEENKKDMTAEEEVAKLHEEANKKIEEAVKLLNDACEDIGKNPMFKHMMIVGYVDLGIVQGFISSNNNLNSIESQTTYLLDYMSRNIKEKVRQEAERRREEIKEAIKQEAERQDMEKGDNKDE